MLNGGLAQLGEHLPYKQEVTGSSPVSSIESLAQLVEHLTFNQRVGSSSLPRLIGPEKTQAGVAELADALDLGSSVFGRVGSSPTTRIANHILTIYADLAQLVEHLSCKQGVVRSSRIIGIIYYAEVVQW